MITIPGAPVPTPRAALRPMGSTHDDQSDRVAPQPGDVALIASRLHRRRVLITGASGFIGRHLTRHLLDAGAEVHALIRPGSVRQPTANGHRVHWHRCELGDPAAVADALEETAAEVVFHLASQVQGDRDPDLVLPMLDDNTRTAVSVMTAAHRRPGCRVVLAGSVEEPHTLGEAPCSPYVAGKAAATAYARLFHDQWGLPVTVLRLAMVYGPDQPDVRKLVPHVITHLLAGRRPPLGSGARAIDWSYVDDVCRAFLLAATHPEAPGLVADIGSGTATTIAETVSLLAELTGHHGDLGFGELADRRRDIARIADARTAQTVLGWQPHTPLARGLARTVRWYQHRDLPDPHDPDGSICSEPAFSGTNSCAAHPFRYSLTP